MPNRLFPTGGSTDWAGANAPAGGLHTGTSTLTMTDGTSYLVAHSRAEALRKLDFTHTIAPASRALTPWVAFDVLGSAVPVTLDASQVASVT